MNDQTPRQTPHQAPRQAPLRVTTTQTPEVAS